jgi:hypothetical protein
VFRKYHLEGIVDFKNNIIPRAVSEHKFSSLCEHARGTLCFPALQHKVPHPCSGADLPIHAK